MDKLFAKRMDELVPSGIRKVNEKALAMERAGETVIHFELGRPDFDTPEYIKNACIEDIKKGDVVGIIGPSGTGKSTLLRCVNRLETPERGTVTIGDKTIDLSEKKPKDLLYP